jgi:hypothetical protein
MIGVLWGALAAHLLILSLGLLLLRPLRLRLSLGETWAAAAACGLPAGLLLIHALAAAGLFRRGVVQALAVLLVLLAARLYRGIEFAPVRLPPWACLPILPFLVWLVIKALRPDSTPPSQDWALVAAHRFVSGFDPPAWNIGAVYSVPYLLGRHNSVALFHASLFFPLVLAFARTGIVGMILVVSHPALLALAWHAGSAVAFTLSCTAAAGLILLAAFQRSWKPLLLAVLASVAASMSWPGPLDVFSGFVFLKTPWWLAPPLAALLAWLVRPVRLAALALALFAILTGWPRITPLLAPARLSQDAFSGFVEARFLDLLPPRSAVLSQIPMPAAWVPRRLFNRPDWLEEARRVARAQWGVRTFPYSASNLIEANPPGFLGEVLLFSAGVEIPRRPEWKVWPPEAFDGLPFTGAAGPVRILLPQSVPAGELRITGLDGSLWRPPAGAGLRRNVILEWKRRGLTHVLVNDRLLVDEFSLHGSYWGVESLGERNGACLYALR